MPRMYLVSSRTYVGGSWIYPRSCGICRKLPNIPGARGGGGGDSSVLDANHLPN